MMVVEMDINEAIQILEDHQIWRRGADTQQTDPKTLGLAIDRILQYYKSLQKVIKN